MSASISRGSRRQVSKFNRKYRKQTEDFFAGRSKVISALGNYRDVVGTFKNQLNRHQRKYDDMTHHSTVRNDYAHLFQPSDDIFDSSGQTGDGRRPQFKDLEMLAFERVGIGRYFTQLFAGKCVRTGFDLYAWDNNLKRHKEMMINLLRAKFFTEQIHWVTSELIYGTSFLLKYWTAHDKFHLPPPKTPPRAYKAFPPTYLTPFNIVDTDMLWEDPSRWEFYGGKYKTARIHPDRVEILCTRPNPNSWIGYSIFEPIYLSASAYMNLIINGAKMTAKWSNVVTSFQMNVPNPSLKMYREFQELIEDMKANLTFVIAKDEKIEFHDTKIGAGLNEFAEILKQDMAAGTGLPLNQTYGRAESGGMGDGGAIMSKQGELETCSNYQADLADNFWALFDQYWDVGEEFLKFRLDFQKSDRSRYEEEQLQWGTELIKAQVEQAKFANLQAAIELQFKLDHPETMIGDQNGGTPGDQTGAGGKKEGNDKEKPERPGNGSAKKEKELTISKDFAGFNDLKEANSIYINNKMRELNLFKPRVIDAEWRR